MYLFYLFFESLNLHVGLLILLQRLPPYPLPTHEADVRGGVPNQFAECLVAYDDIAKHNLPKALNLRDALSDLPKVCISSFVFGIFNFWCIL